MASTSTSKVVLILGSGPNIGQSLAQAFKAKGYKVAVTSRKAKSEDSTTDQLHISSDLSNPNSVIEVFSKVKAAFGIPSVVVYNGMFYIIIPNYQLSNAYTYAFVESYPKDIQKTVLNV